MTRHQLPLLLFSACLLPLTHSLDCYDLVKCSSLNTYRTIICKSSHEANCVHTNTNVMCPREKGNSVPCNPDWFHGNCRCGAIAEAASITGEERCQCDLDKQSIGIVVGVSVAALICAAAAVFYGSRWQKMKKVAQQARIENRVLSQVLENKTAIERSENRTANEYDTGAVSGQMAVDIASAPPPGADVAAAEPVGGSKRVDEEDDILEEENIYMEVDSEGPAPVVASIV